MPDKKDLILNTALADLRHVTEETISAYRQVKINAATVLTTPRVQELCARYGCAIDAAVLLFRKTRLLPSIMGPLPLRRAPRLPPAPLCK